MFKKRGEKVFVGLSGGVDSAVSAALLKEEGYEVTGVFIKIALPGYPCSAGQDKIDAMRVAAHLKIPFVEIDLSQAYKDEVFAYTIAEFAKGRTPNPDTLCNQKIKFGHFYDYAMSHGADFVATGHYTRVALHESKASGVHEFSAENSLMCSASLRSPPQPSFVSLYTGVDVNKDQSYFLWMVPETHLQKTLFPVGHLTKPQVRALAQKFGLPNAARKDSQGLCFLSDISIEDMLTRELHPVPGQVVDESGAVIGTHEGVQLYTLGQRHGFELATHSHSMPPYFVIAKKTETNTLVVSTSRFPQHTQRTEISLTTTNWIGPVESGNYTARYRYRGALIPATLDVELGKVTLHEPHYVPEGQSLVLYNAERCLGGGIVDISTLI